MKKIKKIGVGITAAVLLAVICSVWYIKDYYPVTDRDTAMCETELVTVNGMEDGYFYDGSGEDAALIFYPGAKVEDLAYAQLLKTIAEQGVDCFLVHMPCNLAFLGMNRAEEIMSSYNYKYWYLAGHSLGGAMAANYAAEHSEKLDGLILLAAYSTKDLSVSDLKVLSIYGSEDEIVNRKKIESGRARMPADYMEYSIEGGNHAQYGDYGVQKGDGKALISAEEQRKITAEQIVESILH